MPAEETTALLLQRVRAVDSAYAGGVAAEGAFSLPFDPDAIFTNGFDLPGVEI